MCKGKILIVFLLLSADLIFGKYFLVICNNDIKRNVGVQAVSSLRCNVRLQFLYSDEEQKNNEKEQNERKETVLVLTE